MRLSIVATLAFYIACIPPHAAASSASCANNPSKTLSEYLRILDGRLQNSHDPIFQFVPSDAKIFDSQVMYVVPAYASFHVLPSEESLVEGGMRANSRFVPSCRVQSPDGKWWLGTKNRDGYLKYISIDQTEKAAEYDAHWRAERRNPK
jgi:hypothetical protein